MVLSRTLPVTLQPIVHPSVAPALSRLSRSGPPDQPVLLTGPRSVGKDAVARFLAKSWNCTNHEKQPCGRCSECRAVAQGAGERFTILDGSDGTVEGLAAFKSRARLLPGTGTHVVVLTNAERATLPALQGLLKILEDPPRATVFILTSANPGLLPATVTSRCLSLALPPLDLKTAQAFLQAIGIPSTRVRPILNAAQGLPGLLVRFAADPETMFQRSSAVAQVLELLTLPLAEGLSQIPTEGLDPPAAGAALSSLLRRSFGLSEVWAHDEKRFPTLSPAAVARAGFEFLTDQAADRFTARLVAERLLLAIHRP